MEKIKHKNNVGDRAPEKVNFCILHVVQQSPMAEISACVCSNLTM